MNQWIEYEINPPNTKHLKHVVCVQVRRASVTQATDDPEAETDPRVHPPAGPLRRGGGGGWGGPPRRPRTHRLHRPAPLRSPGPSVQTARRAHGGLPGEAGPPGPRAAVLLPGLQHLLHRRQRGVREVRGYRGNQAWLPAGGEAHGVHQEVTVSTKAGSTLEMTSY